MNVSFINVKKNVKKKNEQSLLNEVEYLGSKILESMFIKNIEIYLLI